MICSHAFQALAADEVERFYELWMAGDAECGIKGAVATGDLAAFHDAFRTCPEATSCKVLAC